MTVNSTYIAQAPDIFDRMARFSSETGFIFGHGIIILIAFFAAYSVRQYGTATSFAYGGFWSFVTALLLFLAGWESKEAVIFCASVTLLAILIIIIDRS